MTESEREKKLEELLARYIRPMKNIPFEVVVSGLCGVPVERMEKR